MATGQEHFALDWIRSELLETLNTARSGLESYVEALEAGADRKEAAVPLHECVNALHQVHGTLVMLELKGVTLLADHLERLASAMLAGSVAADAEQSASQSLMQGILELPGHLEELHAGLPDTEAGFLPLVNELRARLGEAALVREDGMVSLHGSADPAALKRFDEIGGTEKTRKIRAAYQQVLLALLKGGDAARAMDPLRKVAQGMARVCAGTPFQVQWQAFGEFVESLAVADAGGGALDAGVVKVLRRVDSEIREIAKAGAAALQRPVPINLVRQLLDGAAARGRRSELLDELTAAAAESGGSDAMSQSGRQALVSAATALREELGTVKDRLDLFVRGGCADSAELDSLQAPLQQIGSTLSLLGFESARCTVMDQVEAIAALVEAGRCEEAQILGIAGSLVQVDENLASLTQGGKGEKELITDEAQRQVVRQARDGLDLVKQSIVDYVSSQWDVRHLEETPAQLDSIAGALGIVPLTRAAGLVQSCRGYVRNELMAGHAPTWDELDRLADVLSGIDYYLERLASEKPGGAEDVLTLAQQSLASLGGSAEPADAAAAADESDAVADAVPDATADAVPDATADAAAGSGAPAEVPTLAPEAAEQPPRPAADPEPVGDDALFGDAGTVDAAAVGSDEDEAEPTLELEVEEDFDLSSSLFDELALPAADAASADREEPTAAAEPGEPEAEPADLRVAGPDGAEAEPAQAPSPSQSDAAAYVPASLADTYESDDDIVEIFGEEVDEVLESIDTHLDGWSGVLDDETHLGEIRRAFHTLKGSGRLVGANILGEMAWSVENMLNRVLDGTVPVTGDFVQVVREARGLVPQLRDTYQRRGAPDMAAVGTIMERADVLASGGSLADVETAHADSAAAPQTPPADPAATEAATREGTDADLEDSDTDLFVEEAVGLVATLESATDAAGVTLDDDVLRALHTLSGSAALAGLDAVAELAQPAYEVAQALRPAGGTQRLDGDAAQFFREVAGAMSAALDALRAGRQPEEQFQLVAEADRLLVEGSPAPSRTLLTLPALGSLMKAPELLDGWRDGAVDLGLAAEVADALAVIERVAREEAVEPVAELCGSLHRAHGRFEFEALGAADHDVFTRGHDQLLEQFDALAADQTPVVAPATLAELDGLMPSAPAEAPLDQALVEASEVPDMAPPDTAFPASEVPTLELEADPEPEAPAAAPAQEDRAASVAASPAPVELVPEDVDADIIEVFFEEADELLEALDQGISDWSEETDNRLHLENLLRALHTLKGGARLSGLTHLGDRTHEFESFLITQQESEAPAQPALFDQLHAWYDELAGLVAAIRASLAGETPAEVSAAAAPPRSDTAAPEAAPDQAPAEAVDAGAAAPADVSDEAVSEGAEASADSTGAAAPAAAPEELPEPALPLAAENSDRDQRPPRPALRAVATAPEEANPESAAAQTRPAQEMVRVGAGLLESLVNLAGESSIIRARVEQGMSDFTGALDEMETTIERLREQLRRLEIETETQVLFRRERLDGPEYEDFDPLEMDRYSQLQQLSRSLGESASDMLDLKETLLYKAREAETLLLQQARVNTELQEGLMRSRMVPFGRLVPRLKRTVRQVARELDKQVELRAINVEGELDRTLLERMVPPLEHMLRNAVDHGIEHPNTRRKAGKAEAGRIDLRLSREGGDVVIEISDDGAGIDVERVRKKAIERGLMTADAMLRDDEISQFVLAPGFSTAASVTQISGRGVGMDVVHSEVKQLGGSINILSESGRGTRFVVRVPFTVSVNRALMVSVGDDLYAIPLNTIEGIVLLSPAELERLYAPDGNTFEYAGVPYRVQYLGNFLGREYHSQAQQTSVPLVLVRSGEHAVAVHVDGVQGSREIVVKSLGPQFAGVGGISGATILGDGSVVVILDLLALIRTQRAPDVTRGRRSAAGAARTRCVMVVDDSVTVRKVTSRLLERQGMDVVVAKDGVEAVSMLQERRPDVMLLDIEMPRMDGFEVLRQVRRDEQLKDLPIVMISSRTGAKHQERAAELGVSRFLGKPFQESELLGTIDDLVD